MMRVGFLGGTFDPVHNGHLMLAQAALSQLRLSRVYFVLSPQSPFKQHRSITSVADRLSMLRLALHGKPGMSVGLWEKDRPGPHYTATTLRLLKSRFPRHHLFFIMGSDTMRSFPRWKNPHEIAELATLVVGLRPGSAVVPFSPRFKDEIVVLKGRFPDFSSTAVREGGKGGHLPGRDVPPAVFRYIQRKGLYQ
ncbi:nicotinate (nicotinamide) nucleotide adenylyltransferase [bacterium F11]|nr:nicotinate (nicotinamide) nucleotide adenylyltransferase [bacterium F11]